jgi:phosphoglycerate dehydrogenase-like enzyme
VEVVHSPEANTRAVVEFVWSLILSRLRPFRALQGAVDAKRWHAIRAEDVRPRQLCELTLGVYGLGRIGTSMARVGRAMEMRVIFCDLLDIPESQRAGAQPVLRETLLREADILTVHVDSRASNRGLIGAEALALVKPDVLLINSSRGFVVDTPALAAFLRSHPRAHAMLDVHDPEPPPPDYPLWGLASATLTPHEAAATALARENMSWVVRDVWAVLSGSSPAFPAPDLR